MGDKKCHLPQREPHTGYLTDCFKNRKTTIETIVTRLKYLMKKKGLKFDAIAFTGMSGGLMAPTVADALGVGLMAIRKDQSSPHTSLKVEATPECYEYIILDDMISTGDTINKIMDQLGKHHCQGIYVYADNQRQCVGRTEMENLYAPCLNAIGSNIK